MQEVEKTPTLWFQQRARTDSEQFLATGIENSGIIVSDLTISCYFFWGCLKELVYISKSSAMKHLNKNIRMKITISWKIDSKNHVLLSF